MGENKFNLFNLSSVTHRTGTDPLQNYNREKPSCSNLVGEQEKISLRFTHKFSQKHIHVCVCV